MHNFSSLLNITLHVSDGLSVHHQEFKTVHTASGMSYRFIDCMLAGTLAGSQRTCMTYTWRCMYSPGLLMTDGKIVRNT